MSIELTAAQKKIVSFALFGAAGCFVFALLLGEPTLAMLLPKEEPPTKQAVDIMFVLDVTGSMSDEIRGVTNGIEDFVDTFRLNELDARVGLIAFGDGFIGEQPIVLRFEGGPFTSDPEIFRSQLETVVLMNGGDDPESSFDAVDRAVGQPYRDKATKIIVLITDAPPHVPDVKVRSANELERATRAKGIDQLHLVVDEKDRSFYIGLQRETSGKIFSLSETAAGRAGFDAVLADIGEKIVELIPVSPITKGRLEDPRRLESLVATGLWTAWLSVGMFLALVIGQRRYLRQRLPTIKEGFLGAGGSLLAGLLGGAVGFAAFGVFAGTAGTFVADIFGRIIAWAILGALLGIGLAFVVPNLKLLRGLVGGAVGGAIGAIGFLIAGLVLGEVIGRLLGAVIVGFFIGAMIALVEAMFREAWLEIHYGPKEMRTVALGRTPIAIGSNAESCTVFARGAADIALRYTLQDGRISCEDVPAGRTVDVEPGNRRTAGKLDVVVCAARPKLSAVSSPERTREPTRSTGARGEQKVEAASPIQADVSDALFQLRVRGRRIPLTIGSRLTSSDLAGLETTEPDGAVAEVAAHPKDPDTLGLRNLSKRPWVATMADGDQKQVEPRKSVRLAVGVDINFGVLKGVIE